MAALLVQTATPATRLLFVTSRTAMDQAGLTQRELHAATTSGGHKVILLPNNLGDKVSVRAQTAARLVRERTPNWQQFDGVVLIGGYDSVPPQRLDCLDPELRKAAAEAAADDGEFIDSDGYLVWNDDHYADFISTRIPERPVSRIPCWPKHGRGFPDCGTVVRGQLHGLKTKPPSSPRALGMRSNEFPFAKHVFDKFFGGRDVQLQSFPQAGGAVPLDFDRLCSGNIYVVLHGISNAGTVFTDEGGGRVIDIGSWPDPSPKKRLTTLAFTSACWGALAGRDTAAGASNSLALQPRGPRDSVALRMLAHGTGAVIGFTGSHHGPKIPIGGGFGYLGAPFHEALWDELINKGRPPASALFEARRRYLAGAPYRTPFEQPGGDPLGVPYARAVEQKTFWSATCLGMGW